MSGGRSYSLYFFGEETELRKILSNNWDSEKGFSTDGVKTGHWEYNLYEKALSVNSSLVWEEFEPDDFYSLLNIIKDIKVSICLLGSNSDAGIIYFGFKNETGKTFANFFGLEQGFKEFHKYINLKLFGFSDWENEVLVNHDKLGEPKESEKDEESKKLDSPEWRDFIENHTSLIKEGKKWEQSTDDKKIEKDNWDG